MRRIKAKKDIEYPYLVKGIVRITRTKNRGQDSFVVSYVSPDKGRVQRRFKDEGKALAEAKKTASTLTREGVEGMKFTIADRAALVDAMRELDPLGVSIVAAAHTFAEAFKTLGGNRIMEAAQFFKARMEADLPTFTVEEAVRRYCAAKEAEGISRRHRGDLRHYLVLNLVPAMRCTLTSITPDILRDYLNSRGGGPVSKDNHRRAITAFFNFAKASGWLSKHEETAAAPIRPYKSKKAEVSIYTPAEVAKLLAAADPEFRVWLALIAFGGVRNEEMRKGLRWEDIDFPRGVLIVPAAIAKTGRKRIIEMPDNLRAWLAPHALRAGPIFATWPFDRITQLAIDAKVPWKRNALRHSFGSYRIAQTKNAGQVALEMGNSPTVIMSHYHEVIRDPGETLKYWAIRPDER